MELKINDSTFQVADDSSDLLLWYLRDELGMTGTKFGCGAGICGACTVHVDGVATRSCITPVQVVAGKEIRTIEGLAETNPGPGGLHPVQQAFIDNQVPQCGWCMSGQIMQASAFLAATPAPSEEQIVEAMGQNYCRCGCYVRIKDAVTAAADQMVARAPITLEVPA
ncbi:MAG: (2Fe-2S)-binding protein [Candidatus Zophobacter franzmannii]|nr:(2Fe-2S)-binding protein [Candidatus Zophobacter franzmannii]